MGSVRTVPWPEAGGLMLTAFNCVVCQYPVPVTQMERHFQSHAATLIAEAESYANREPAS